MHTLFQHYNNFHPTFHFHTPTVVSESLPPSPSPSSIPIPLPLVNRVLQTSSYPILPLAICYSVTVFLRTPDMRDHSISVSHSHFNQHYSLQIHAHIANDMVYIIYTYIVYITLYIQYITCIYMIYVYTQFALQNINNIYYLLFIL